MTPATLSRLFFMLQEFYEQQHVTKFKGTYRG